MKKTKRIVIISLILLPVLLYSCIVIANNNIAKDLERQLLNCPLPPRTELIDSISIAGKTEGNGNGMQWYGELLIESTLNEAELMDYYNKALTVDEDSFLWVYHQESPYIFDYQNYTFNGFTGSSDSYRIELYKGSVVGCESSLWESLLNSDIRGH